MSPVCKNSNILSLGGSTFRHIGPEAQTPGENGDVYGESAGPKAREDAADWLNARRTASRNGTTEFAPLWDGPRLRPAFVTQLLGQAFPHVDSPDRRSGSAYVAHRSERGMLCARTA